MVSSGLHEVADRHGPLVQPPRLEPDAIRRVDPQLKRVLDGDDPLVVGEEFNEGVEQRGLAAAGSRRSQEAGLPVKDLCRRHGFSEASYYLWRSKFGGMSVSDAKRLKELEPENGRLKKLVAESQLEIEVTREGLRKKWGPLRVGPPGDGRGDGACARPCFQRDARAIERGKGRAFGQIILCQRANSFSFPNR